MAGLGLLIFFLRNFEYMFMREITLYIFFFKGEHILVFAVRVILLAS